MPYLFEAVASNEEFEDDFHGAGSITNLNSYTWYQVRAVLCPMLAASGLFEFTVAQMRAYT
jgi:hypothetical protein